MTLPVGNWYSPATSFFTFFGRCFHWKRKKIGTETAVFFFSTAGNMPFLLQKKIFQKSLSIFSNHAIFKQNAIFCYLSDVSQKKGIVNETYSLNTFDFSPPFVRPTNYAFFFQKFRIYKRL